MYKESAQNLANLAKPAKALVRTPPRLTNSAKNPAKNRPY
jgi:hypothetical protein